ncbi:MAG TPA: class I SAM-dependent methyltransferase [Thermoanaerobaculia bacterium]|nr:class I SAM-dependent methyltransferase [Thermoanaerobaculia bacterium]
MTAPARHHWTVAEVADALGPSANVRNYLEQRDVRRCLQAASAIKPVARACDVGCGYGRLTMVLAEVAKQVVGFERESTFVAEARRLLPQIEFHQIEALSNLPASSGSFDFVMTFTVLQHLGDAEARQVAAELKRLGQGGCVLLTEETDAAFMDGAEGGGITKGRAVATYGEWMRPFDLVLRFPRQIEPGYPRSDVGTYMLFADSASRG